MEEQKDAYEAEIDAQISEIEETLKEEGIYVGSYEGLGGSSEQQAQNAANEQTTGSAERVTRMVFMPRRNVNKPAIIVELKWNKTASAAIEQIKNRQYIESLKGYSGEVVLVGINYDDGDFKKHVCRIEKVKVG